MIEKKPFQRYSEEKKRDNITVSLNPKERETLNASKLIIEQPKDSTAFKTLAWIGANVIQDKNMRYVISTLFKNKRNNERLGIVDFD